MDDERGSTVRPIDTSGSSRMAQWGRGLETTKVGPLTVVVFIAILGIFSAAAAGVGYLTHSLAGHKPALQSEVPPPKPNVP